MIRPVLIYLTLPLLVSKIDLLKGYWQVPFSVSTGYFHICETFSIVHVYCHEFWTCNVPVIFQRLMNLEAASLDLWYTLMCLVTPGWSLSYCCSTSQSVSSLWSILYFVDIAVIRSVNLFISTTLRTTITCVLWPPLRQHSYLWWDRLSLPACPLYESAWDCALLLRENERCCRAVRPHTDDTEGFWVVFFFLAFSQLQAFRQATLHLPAKYAKVQSFTDCKHFIWKMPSILFSLLTYALIQSTMETFSIVKKSRGEGCLWLAF